MARFHWVVAGLSLGGLSPILQAQDFLRQELEPLENSRLEAREHGHPFQRMFRQAARKFDVPVEVLLALSFTETRWQPPPPGEASLSGGHGMLHLSAGPGPYSLERAARLTSLNPEAIRDQDWANVMGGAAVLRFLADEAGLSDAARKDPGAWFEVLAKVSGLSDPRQAADYAEGVLSYVREGVKAEAGADPGAGQGNLELVMPGRNVEMQKCTYAFLPPTPENLDRMDTPAFLPQGVQSLAPYPPSIWDPADPGNYRIMNRPADHDIDRVVIHDIEGSYASGINTFKDPTSNKSAHFVIRSRDGQITQMVRQKDEAYHVRCWNPRTIGIEHEGYAAHPNAWFTDAMYRSSAKLVAAICDRYGIPKDRTHVVGHNDVSRITSCTTHTDPGSGWDWDKFMGYVRAAGGSDTPSFDVTVDNGSSAFSASSNWGTSSAVSTRHGATYRYATPYEGRSDAAWYTVTLPHHGRYEVFAWWPSNAAYNSSTPFVVMTAGGPEAVHHDQRVNGGKWNSLGTFTFQAGAQDLVGVSRWTSAGGHVIADAIRVVAR